VIELPLDSRNRSDGGRHTGYFWVTASGIKACGVIVQACAKALGCALGSQIARNDNGSVTNVIQQGFEVAHVNSGKPCFRRPAANRRHRPIRTSGHRKGGPNLSPGVVLAKNPLMDSCHQTGSR